MNAPLCQENGSDPLVSLEGIIVPVKWNADGEVAAIAIETTDERQLLVDENTGIGKELRHWLTSPVQLRGRVRKLSESEQIIEVQGYKPIKVKKSNRCNNS